MLVLSLVWVFVVPAVVGLDCGAPLTPVDGLESISRLEIKRSTQFDCSLPFDLLVLSELLRELHCELNRLLDAIGARFVFLLAWSVKCGLCCIYCVYWCTISSVYTVCIVFVKCTVCSVYTLWVYERSLFYPIICVWKNHLANKILRFVSIWLIRN